MRPGSVVRMRLTHTGVSRVFTLGIDGLWRCGAWAISSELFDECAYIEEVLVK